MTRAAILLALAAAVLLALARRHRPPSPGRGWEPMPWEPRSDNGTTPIEATVVMYRRMGAL